MTGTCQQCQHAHQGQQAGATALFCRRYPPTLIVRDQPAQRVHGFRDPVPGGLGMFGWYPPTAPEGTCGEYAQMHQVVS